MSKSLKISKSIVASTNILVNGMALSYSGHTHSVTGPAGINYYRNAGSSGSGQSAIALNNVVCQSDICIYGGIITSINDGEIYDNWFTSSIRGSQSAPTSNSSIATWGDSLKIFTNTTNEELSSIASGLKFSSAFYRWTTGSSWYNHSNKCFFTRSNGTISTTMTAVIPTIVNTSNKKCGIQATVKSITSNGFTVEWYGWKTDEKPTGLYCSLLSYGTGNIIL